MTESNIQNYIDGLKCGLNVGNNESNINQFKACIDAWNESIGGDLTTSVSLSKFIQNLANKLSTIQIDEYNDTITHHAEYKNNHLNVSQQYWEYTTCTFASSSFVSRVLAMAEIKDNSITPCRLQIKLTHYDDICEVAGVFILCCLHHIIHDRQNISINMIEKYADYAKFDLVSPPNMPKKNLTKEYVALFDYHIKLGLSGKCINIYNDTVVSEDHIMKSVAYATYAIDAICTSIKLNKLPSFKKILDNINLLCNDNKSLIMCIIGAFIGIDKIPESFNVLPF